MEGQLLVWGYDSNGFWKRRIDCKHDEVHSLLATINGYDDYDFEISE